MGALWVIGGLLLAAVAGLCIVYGAFRWKLSQGAKAWQQVGQALNLSFEPHPSKLGVLSGALDGLPVVVDVVNTEDGPEPEIQTYTRIHIAVDGASAERAASELAAASHGFVGLVDHTGVRWMRVGIVFDPRTLRLALDHALAAAVAAR